MKFLVVLITPRNQKPTTKPRKPNRQKRQNKTKLNETQKANLSSLVLSMKRSHLFRGSQYLSPTRVERHKACQNRATWLKGEAGLNPTGRSPLHTITTRTQRQQRTTVGTSMARQAASSMWIKEQRFTKGIYLPAKPAALRSDLERSD